MTTLIIHPKDKTTDFLSAIYAGIIDKTVICHSTRRIIRREILTHDKIIMLGHGSKYGLFGDQNFAIDSTCIQALRGKKDSVFIWCHANGFVGRYDLLGFNTGMIISDKEEAIMYDVEATPQEIKQSNELFADAVRQAIHLSPEEMKDEVKRLYVSDTNKVIQYNRENIYAATKTWAEMMHPNLKVTS